MTCERENIAKLTPLVALLITMLAGALNGVVRADDTREALCKLLPNGNVCVGVTVKLLGESPPNSLSKKGKTLTVIAKDGRKRFWQDGEGETGVRYESSGFIEPHKYFWISGFSYEDQSHELVSYETGSSYKLEGFPFFSPDGAHFVIQVTPHGTNPQSVKIYSISRDKITELAKYDIAHLRRVGQPLWVSPTEIVLLSLRYDPATTASFTGPPILARIRKLGTGWDWFGEVRK